MFGLESANVHTSFIDAFYYTHFDNVSKRFFIYNRSDSYSPIDNLLCSY